MSKILEVTGEAKGVSTVSRYNSDIKGCEVVREVDFFFYYPGISRSYLITIIDNEGCCEMGDKVKITVVKGE